MANPTSNFGWQMPTPTDLVTDLPADFEVFGQAVDTSMADLKGGTSGQVLAKNSNTDMDFVWITNDQGDITAVTAGTGISGGGTSGAVTITNDMATTITASGDIVVGTGSGTYDNLPIGTTGQILTADTTVSPYKVKWATPAAASSGMTKITSNTFSNVASVAIDSVFSSTYKNYVAVIKAYAVTGSDDLQLQMRYAGPTTQTTTYYGAQFNYSRANTLDTNGFSNAAQATIAASAGASGGPSLATLNFSQVGNTSEQAFMYGTGIDNGQQNACVFSMQQDTARIYTGFLLKSSSTNITGSYAVYGLEA